MKQNNLRDAIEVEIKIANPIELEEVIVGALNNESYESLIKGLVFFIKNLYLKDFIYSYFIKMFYQEKILPQYQPIFIHHRL